MKNRIIPLLLVPAFVLSGCNTQEPEKIAVPQTIDCVNVNETSGAMSVDASVKSYCDVVANGYTGSYQDWQEVVKTYQEDPEKASQMASSSGYSGSDVLLGAVAGAAVGAMMANSMNSRSTHAAYASTSPTNTSSNLTNSRTAAPSVSSTSAKAPVSYSPPPSNTTAVSRGGFGGAVSSGG